jgi:PBSX family phage portal protein
MAAGKLGNGRGMDRVVETAKSFDAGIADVRVRLLDRRPVTVAEELMGTSKASTVANLAKHDIGEPDATTGTNQVYRDDYATAFTTLGAIDPVYDPEMLALLFEHSNSLRQNVDSYAVNIDGFGHRFDPLFDLSSKNVDQRIGDAIFSDRQRALDEAADPKDAVYPTPEEIKTKRAQIEKEMRMEKVRLTHFFEFCSPDESFVTLRKKTRQDIETTGNGYWEILRNNSGQIVQFIYMASFTMRLLPLDTVPVTIKQKVRVSELSFDDVERTIRMRRYVQVVEGRAVFFREFGDPRIISSQSGAVFPDLETMKREEPQSRPANEVLHFKIHSSRSPYGVPRWIGNLLSVIGSRQAEEVNFNYFENKSVPPLAILVSGGRMSEDSVGRIEDYIESNIKGKRNFHKILVLEAEQGGGEAASASNTAKMRIQIQPLTGAQHNDALFQNYDERNIDKVGMSFRLPRMLRGDIRDFNRASADSALVFAEMQVFEPERQDTDFVLNRKVLTALGVKFWRLVSLAPVMRDPTAMSEIIKNLMNANVLTPEEARELAGDVFNKEFKHLTADWTKQPPALTIAGVPVQQEAKEGEPTGPSEPTDAPGFSANEVDPDKPEGEGIEARMKGKLGRARFKQAASILAMRKALRLADSEAWTDRMLEAALAGE